MQSSQSLSSLKSDKMQLVLQLLEAISFNSAVIQAKLDYQKKTGFFSSLWKFGSIDAGDGIGERIQKVLDDNKDKSILVQLYSLLKMDTKETRTSFKWLLVQALAKEASPEGIIAETDEEAHQWVAAMIEQVKVNFIRYVLETITRLSLEDAIAKAVKLYAEHTKSFSPLRALSITKNAEESIKDRVKAIREKNPEHNKNVSMFLRALLFDEEGKMTPTSFKYFLVSELTKMTANSDQESSWLVQQMKDEIERDQTIEPVRAARIIDGLSHARGACLPNI